MRSPFPSVPPIVYTSVVFRDIDKKVEELNREYFSIIGRYYPSSDEYHEAILGWRKKVIEFYKHLKHKRKNIYMASYFVRMMFFRKFNIEPPTVLENIINIHGHFITPENKKYALLRDVADDPNGCLQFVLYYMDTHRDPEIICL